MNERKEKKTMSVPVEFVHDFLFLWDGLACKGEPFYDWPQDEEGLAKYFGWSLDVCCKHIDRACGRPEGGRLDVKPTNAQDVVSVATAINICREKMGFSVSKNTLRELVGAEGRFVHLGEHRMTEENDCRFHLIGVKRSRFMNFLNCRSAARNANELFDGSGLGE